MNDVGLENLRIAILRQAVTDYKRALKDGETGKANRLEQFFTSTWGEMLSGGNGEYIISACKKQLNARRLRRYETLSQKKKTNVIDK